MAYEFAIGESVSDGWLFVGDDLCVNADTGAVGRVSNGQTDRGLGIVPDHLLSARPADCVEDDAAWGDWAGNIRDHLAPKLAPQFAISST